MNKYTISDKIIDEAVSKAEHAMSLSYVPYSEFQMGAAVITEKGIILTGSLVENVSLGLAMCAERIALFSTISQAAGKHNVLVLISERTNGDITYPCGACLQVAMELGGPELEIVACDTNGNRQKDLITDIACKLPRKNSES